MNTICLIFIFSTVILSTSAFAADELNYNLIQLSAQTEKQVENDLFVVTLSAMAEMGNSKDAAQLVNADMAWAIDLLEDKPEIKRQTLNYQTHPVYKNKTIIGWNARQQLRLESRKIERLSELVGMLQEKLTVISMQFEVSTEKQNNAVKALIGSALDEFKSKARLVATAIGAVDYRIVSISIRDTPPPAARFRTATMEAMSSVEA
ncbi:MAG: SIMPL domain-containing protein, partial [Deltaproteobacteria bacterium]|nr:SIMPL domain-containing protein [Deltaproteobacteria bacterium]